MVAKKDIIKEIAKRTGVSQKNVNEVLSAYSDCVYSALETGDSIRVVEGVVFKLKDVNARMGRNPQTGEEIEIPAKKKISVSFGTAAKEFLRQYVQ